jgi:hypothetical protein
MSPKPIGTMNLAKLTESELQNLLMEETKKFTTALREGNTPEQKEENRKKIEEIIKLLEARKSRKTL